MKQTTQWPAYAELQTTTNFSFLRGGSHGEELVAAAKALGLAGLAITDRNTLAGVVRAHAAAKEAGLHLITGARLDLSSSSAKPSLPAALEDIPISGRFPGDGGAVIRDLSRLGRDDRPAMDGNGPGYPLRGFRGNDDGVIDAPSPQEPAALAIQSLLCLPTDRAAYGRLSQLLTLGQRRAGKGQCTLFIEDVVAHSAGQILIALPPDDWDWRAIAARATAGR